MTIKPGLGTPKGITEAGMKFWKVEEDKPRIDTYCGLLELEDVQGWRHVSVKSTGCFHYYYYRCQNIKHRPVQDIHNDRACHYIHYCSIDQEIACLQELKTIAKAWYAKQGRPRWPLNAYDHGQDDVQADSIEEHSSDKRVWWQTENFWIGQEKEVEPGSFLELDDTDKNQHVSIRLSGIIEWYYYHEQNDWGKSYHELFEKDEAHREVYTSINDEINRMKEIKTIALQWFPAHGVLDWPD